MKLVVKNKKLVTEQGELFFYTADTAWEIFHKLTYAEACAFIDNRAAKGFNAIQSVVVAELDGLKTPTYEGKLLPFSNLETLEVNEAYFDHVARVIAYANSKGIIMTLVPMWGSYLIANPQWGGKVKPVFDAEKAARFVRYLAKKFSDLDLIWLLGGDRSYLEPEHKALIKAMALAIREVNGAKHLISAHTQGGRSIYDMLEQPDYLDFITWQSGHMGACYPSWRAIESDYQRLNLPVLDAEPCYESHPIMQECTWARSNGMSRFTDKEVRRSSYWSVFSGGAGITYGCYGIWQMRREEDDQQASIPESAASAYQGDKIPYYHQSQNFPGAFQIPYLKDFMSKLPHPLDVYPDNSLILGDNPSGAGHMCAITNKQKEFVAVYVPGRQQVVVDISAFGYDPYEIYWFDPRYNIYNLMSQACSESQFLSLSVPDDNDYVLLVKRAH